MNFLPFIPGMGFRIGISGLSTLQLCRGMLTQKKNCMKSLDKRKREETKKEKKKSRRNEEKEIYLEEEVDEEEKDT